MVPLVTGVRRVLSATLLVAAAACTASGHAQSSYFKTHGVSISVGGMGQLTRSLESDAVPVPYTYAITPGNTTTTTIYPQSQAPTNSFGGVTSLQIHPVPWAGLAFNYSFTHFDEWFHYGTATQAGLTNKNVPTDMHEYTGGYLIHPKHIPFQPYVEVGGGYLNFRGRDGNGDSQFRGAGLFETGFDLPVHSEHIGFRVAARSLYYRSPNFDSPVISTRSWRVTMEPAVSAYYRF